ncbi:MAG: hypothetical protein LBE54_16710 [Brucellaceae bacterium]|jgi:predicted O-linked N-acetylglucosamine transferase (SPINDLY family)|nr:hypothetical protein [Brucellaceae bacterium]
MAIEKILFTPPINIVVDNTKNTLFDFSSLISTLSGALLAGLISLILFIRAMKRERIKEKNIKREEEVSQFIKLHFNLQHAINKLFTVEQYIEDSLNQANDNNEVLKDWSRKIRPSIGSRAREININPDDLYILVKINMAEHVNKIMSIFVNSDNVDFSIEYYRDSILKLQEELSAYSVIDEDKKNATATFTDKQIYNKQEIKYKALDGLIRGIYKKSKENVTSGRSYLTEINDGAKLYFKEEYNYDIPFHLILE